MKIIFVSDAHGNIYAVESFFHAVRKISCDMLVYGGDSCGYYYEADQTVTMMKENADVCLLGNHDKILLELLDGSGDADSLAAKYGSTYRNYKSMLSEDNIEFLRTLGSSFEINCDGLKLCFVHGSISDPLNGRIYPDTEVAEQQAYDGIDYVFSGHTHHKMVKRLDTGCTIINPGSIGQQRDGRGCSFVLFDTGTGSIDYFVVGYDLQKLIKDIKAREDDAGMQEKLTEVLLRKKKYGG